MKEITELSTDELLTKRRDLRQESLHLRLQQQSGQLEQPSRLRLLRRDVARIETVLSQRQKETEKTIVVRTVTRVPHPKFGKIVKQMKKFYAHDEENKAKTGDTVRIMETRPLSKLKRWRLVDIVQK